MTLLNEEVATQNWLIDYLSSDSALMNLVNGITLRSAWTQLACPYVKISKLDASDLQVIGPFRVWADMTFLVRGIDQNRERGLPDWSVVQAIADRLDQLLQAHEANTSSPSMSVHSFRDESFTDETIEGGDLYLHAGGIYRVRAHAN